MVAEPQREDLVWSELECSVWDSAAKAHVCNGWKSGRCAGQISNVLRQLYVAISLCTAFTKRIKLELVTPRDAFDRLTERSALMLVGLAFPDLDHPLSLFDLVVQSPRRFGTNCPVRHTHPTYATDGTRENLPTDPELPLFRGGSIVRRQSCQAHDVHLASKAIHFNGSDGILEGDAALSAFGPDDVTERLDVAGLEDDFLAFGWQMRRAESPAPSRDVDDSRLVIIADG
jgi:hypothetical protein